MDKFYNSDDINNEYDVIILGAGPAGCTAGLYAARDELSTLILESKFPGGHVAITDCIENYPGTGEALSGADLAMKFATQAIGAGASIRNANVVKVHLEGEDKCLTLDNGKVIKSKTLMIGTGTTPKLLGAENEKDFIGKGISFCATCDAGFYRNKDIVVVGGGNSAIEEAIYLTKFVNSVTLVHRRDEFRASNSAVTKAKSNPKIKMELFSAITKFNGDKKVSSVTIKDLKTNEERELPIDGVFLFVGWIPNTTLFEGLIDLTEDKFVAAPETTKTNVEGIYAIGDVRKKELMQIVTAASDGAVAAKFAEHYISSLK